VECSRKTLHRLFLWTEQSKTDVYDEHSAVEVPPFLKLHSRVFVEIDGLETSEID
jgi:hypothetical protein